MLRELKRMLDEGKKYTKPPVAKRGRQRFNSHFGQATFARWREKKIIEYAHLLTWRAVLTARAKCISGKSFEWKGRENIAAGDQRDKSRIAQRARLPAGAGG